MGNRVLRSMFAARFSRVELWGLVIIAALMNARQEQWPVLLIVPLVALAMWGERRLNQEDRNVR